MGKTEQIMVSVESIEWMHTSPPDEDWYDISIILDGDKYDLDDEVQRQAAIEVAVETYLCSQDEHWEMMASGGCSIIEHDKAEVQ